MTTVQTNRRRLVVNELHLVRGRYEIDFDDFETLIIKNRVKLFLLCSPHNPVGRVWTREELRRMGAICLKHGVYILADEIHSDFVYSGYHHIVFADLDAALADRTITCTAPTKTFNLAGLQVANTFVADKKLRAKFKEECDMNGYNMLNTAGLVATEAAYTHGQSWRDALVAYLEDNVSYLRGALQGKRIELIQPEGTYLMWLDCRQLGLSDPQLDAFFTDQAKLWLHKGWTFGKCGSGFMRMNIACPRETLRQAMRNLEGVL
jgi:cystathionine beta-lyase